MVPEAHINHAVFFGDELQKFYIGEIVVRDITRDAAGVRRQKVAFKEDLKMFAQYCDGASHRHIEIDMQVADKIVGHTLKFIIAIFGCQGSGFRIFFALGIVTTVWRPFGKLGDLFQCYSAEGPSQELRGGAVGAHGRPCDIARPCPWARERPKGKYSLTTHFYRITGSFDSTSVSLRMTPLICNN